MPELSYLQAVVIGGLQGVTELFPVSSLGHSVLVPALVGGSWSHLVTEGAAQDSEHSPYLAFIVALHVATALALLVFYWRDWVRIVGAFIRPSDPAAPPAIAELRAHMRAHLSPQKTPTKWYVVDGFPLTGSGKVQKFALRETWEKGGYDDAELG